MSCAEGFGVSRRDLLDDLLSGGVGGRLVVVVFGVCIGVRGVAPFVI